MTQEELLKAFNESYSISAFRGMRPSLKLLGIVNDGDRYSWVYRDSEGNYWHETKFRKNGRFITEYEHIFGLPEHLHKRHLMTAKRNN